MSKAARNAAAEQPKQEEESNSSVAAALALQHAILRCDEHAVQQVVAADAAALEQALVPAAGLPPVPLVWKGIGALHAAVFADWSQAVQLLVELGADVDAAMGLEGGDACTQARLEGMGVPEQQARVVRGPNRPASPLELAVRTGAVDVAAALMAAGAKADAAFEQLPALAREATAELGAAAAAEAVPALVQQLASVLCRRPVEASAFMILHQTAVELAWPTPPAAFPSCPWLQGQLLSRHTDGTWAGSFALKRSCVQTALPILLTAAEGRQRAPPAQLAALAAGITQWLHVPAAAGLEPGRLLGMGLRLCQLGMGATVLPALLEHEAVQQALTQAAQLPPAEAEHAKQRPEAALLCAAASSGQAAAVDAILAAMGSGPTLNAVNAIISDGCDLRALSLLLSRGPSLQPRDGMPLTAWPPYALLSRRQSENDAVEVDYLDGEVLLPAGEEAYQEQHRSDLAAVELLAAAGYRPVVLRNCMLPSGQTVRELFPPDDEVLAEAWEIDSGGSTTKAASARTARAGPLGALPSDVLLRVLELAAYPLSAWQPRMDSGRYIAGAEVCEENCLCKEYDPDRRDSLLDDDSMYW